MQSYCDSLGALESFNSKKRKKAYPSSILVLSC